MIAILKHIQDPELGEVIFRKNSRAKRYIIRCRKGKISVTIPWLGSLKEAELFFSKNRRKLIPILQQMKKQEESKKESIKPEELILLREKAEEYLPEKLKELAKKYGFEYKLCKIGKSRTQWGSCSSSGTIRLSFYIMLLPENLILYVLLHELCHTVHHNHGKLFWKLLDDCTNEKAKQLRKELRNHHIPFQ